MHDLESQFLKDNSTSASVLIAIVLNEYGFDCLDWEALALKVAIEDDFGVALSTVLSDKLQAAITIMSTDHFEWDWHTFNSCIHALNAEPFDFEDFAPVEAEQIASAMPEVEMLTSNFLGEGVRFSDEVNTYAGFIFSEYGLLFAPTIFPTALMPSLQGDYYTDSQSEKQEALNELYGAKKDKIKAELENLKHCWLV